MQWRIRGLSHIKGERMKLSDIGRLKELSTKFDTFDETKRAIEKEFPEVYVVYEYGKVSIRDREME